MVTNEVIKKLENEFNENINSHIFLVETNDYNKCLLEIKKLIKKIIKANDIISNQIDEENFLELIIVRQDGKDIKKDQIAALQKRLKNRPIITNNIFYIILGADLLNDTAANKLLKTIEEPNDNTIGFLITSNIDIILPTIKSRCEIINILFEKENNNIESINELDEITTQIIEIIETKQLIDFNLYKFENKIIKENGKDVANRIKDYYNTACEVEKNLSLNLETISIIKKTNKYSQILAKAKYLNKTLNKLTFNMNSDLLLEKIFIELKEVK